MEFTKEFDMGYEWGWGYQPDEWEETDWIDENGNYHDVSELGGKRKEPKSAIMDTEDIPF